MGRRVVVVPRKKMKKRNLSLNGFETPQGENSQRWWWILPSNTEARWLARQRWWW